eukprot:6265438-Pyramimonas_sp.AAC.1
MHASLLEPGQGDMWQVPGHRAPAPAWGCSSRCGGRNSSPARGPPPPMPRRIELQGGRNRKPKSGSPACGSLPGRWYSASDRGESFRRQCTRAQMHQN